MIGWGVVAGWLIVSGVRGAGGPCLVTAAYNLSSGAGFVYDGCAMPPRGLAGTVPPATLRDTMSRLLEPPATAGPSPPTTPSSPAHSTVTWLWIRDDGRRVIGEAVDVGGVASGWTDGCASALPPTYGVVVATLPTMANPVSADAAQELYQLYRSARSQWAALDQCVPG